MKPITFTMWTDEAVYTKGAVESILKRTCEMRDKIKAQEPDADVAVYDFAIGVYERALKTMTEALGA